MSVEDNIKQMITENKIILFMKGTAQFPQCGFSAKAVSLLKSCDAKFTTVNVLEDPDIRQGIKLFSHWPTIPQLYINGEFVGGSDIIAEMHEAGELQALVQSTI